MMSGQGVYHGGAARKESPFNAGGGGTPPAGGYGELIYVDEGLGNGRVLRSESRLNHTNVGPNATDMTIDDNSSFYDIGASGKNAFACGEETLASGDAAFASNFQTRAEANNSHSEGSQTRVFNSAPHSHVEGLLTSAFDGQACHAEGRATEAGDRDGAHAEGLLTRAIGGVIHASGRYNDPSTDANFWQIGVGFNDAGRANGFELNEEGTIARVPQLSIPDIDSGAPRTIATKEYVQQQSSDLFNNLFSLPYGFDGNLTVNEVVAPVCGNGSFGTTTDTMGYPLSDSNNFRIKGFTFAIQQFVTNGAGSLSITLEYLLADGSANGEYNLGDGVFLDELILPLPDSAGGQRNYIQGSTSELDILIPPNSMLFASVSGRTAQSVNGLTMFIVGQVEEI